MFNISYITNYYPLFDYFIKIELGFYEFIVYT